MAPGSGPKLMLEAEEGGEQLVIKRLWGTLNNPLLSDLCLLCQDRVKVYACRTLLMASSDVLRQMLSNGMAESRMFEVSLPEISSSALLPTLEYLYTGAITQHTMDLNTAFLVFHAANFFNLPMLETRLKPLLLTLVSSLSEYPEMLAHHLSRLDAYGLTHLLDDVVSVVEVSLRRHCCTAQPSTFLSHLSIRAMLSLADSLRSKNEHSTVFSFMEYICLRSLLIWGASHTNAEAVEFFEHALPDEDSLTLHFVALQSSGKSFLEVGLDRTKTKAGGLLTATEVKYVEDLHVFFCNMPWKLKEIELVRIHPVILVMVLKPLNVLDLATARFEEALQYQALHMGEMNLMRWVLPHGESILPYEVQQNGAILFAERLSKLTSPRAFINISFSNPIGVHVMSFIVENLAKELRIFVCSAGACSKAEGVLVCEGLKFCLYVKDNGIQPNRYKQVEKVTSTTGLKRGDQIKVVVDMRKRQCLFQIKGEFELVLENLLEEVFLAGSVSSPGKVRVVLVSDITFV